MKKKNVSASKLNLNKTTLKNLQSGVLAKAIGGGEEVRSLTSFAIDYCLAQSYKVCLPEDPSPLPGSNPIVSTQAPCANFTQLSGFNFCG